MRVDRTAPSTQSGEAIRRGEQKDLDPLFLRAGIVGRAMDALESAHGTGWRARLELELVRSRQRTELGRRRHQGPLRVQRAFHPEGDLAHVYVLHPPGGVVGGDRLELDVRVEANAAALLTTPAAQKIYRSSGAPSHQVTRIAIRRGASLEWFPGETLVFDGASARQITRVDVDEGAAFLGWEMGCFGRPASGLPFHRGTMRVAFEVYREGTPLVLERQHIDGSAAVLSERAGFGGSPAWGTLYALGPRSLAPDLIDGVRAALPRNDEALRCGGTVVADTVVVRVTALSLARVREALVTAWTALRPALLGRQAIMPRVWRT
jgi:urease accessory protein